MQEASFIGFLRVLLYIFIFYYLFKLVFRLFFPMIVNHTVNKMEEKFRQQQANQQPQGRTGETVIDKKPTSHKNKEVDGEYIDYEELE
jgi:hypothetical protein